MDLGLDVALGLTVVVVSASPRGFYLVRSGRDRVRQTPRGSLVHVQSEVQDQVQELDARRSPEGLSSRQWPGLR